VGTPTEIFQRYTYSSAMRRDAVAVAEMFTPDGVLETPLAPAGGAFPPVMAGRDAIRAGLAAYYARTAGTERPVDLERSRFVVHATADPDVFVVEIDPVFVDGGTLPMVKIFRMRGGLIASLRDYFHPDYAV